ncbi:hypothetical protein CFN78_20580 [Amycolatopsis antarctica]|uniref:DUF218 domain-containing protein n=1 Tax=Amycolatopsis antarctica TaxID=1854586 RepID=A0A263D0Z4_9PSEU|nr:YdcF family protein [Amycolatopsis antarctica]OZM71206.1 hypothetical protein CFN78_20580 [Amycolatopsis antarctica]
MLYACSGVLVLLAILSIRQDRRRFRNAVLLGLGLVFLLMALIDDIQRLPASTAGTVATAVILLPLLTVLVLAVFLIANGVTMIRRESRSLGNLLSLLAGLGMIGLLILLAATQYTQNHTIAAVAIPALAALSYVGFLFCCYLGYAFLYGRLRIRPGIDFVVVLGSRVIDGRIPPLLASRLDKAKLLYSTERASGAEPMIVTSGGQGTDEALPESHAMADYLLAAGVPETDVLREDRSTTTEQNLAFSHELMEQRKPGYRCVVVTNNFHAYRAAIMARKATVNGQVAGSPTALYYWPSATIREFAAVLMGHRMVNLGITGILAALGVMVALR